MNPFKRRRSPTGWLRAMIPYNAGAAAVNPLSALFVTQVLGGDVSTVGTLAAVTAVASVPASGVWGDLTDRLGRRGPFIVLGLLGFGVPVLLIGFSQSLLIVYALSFCMGFISLAINPASSALVTEANPRDRWAEAFAAFNWLAGIGAIGGLIIGAIWMDLLPKLVGANLAMRGLMIASGVAVVAAAVLAQLWLPEEKPFARTASPGKPRHVSLRSVLDHLGAWRSDPWMRYIFAYFLGRLSTNLALTPFAVFLKDDLNAPSSVVFIAYVVNQVFPTLFYKPMGNWLRKTSPVRLMMLVSLARALGLGLGALAALAGAGWLGIGLAVVLYGPVIGLTWAGMAVAGPVAVMEMVPPERAGRGMGLYNAVASVATVVGAYFSGVGVLAIGYGGIFLVSLIIGAVGAIAFLLVKVR